MNNKRTLLAITMVAVMLMSSLFVSAKNIEDIIGTNPDIKKVNEKLDELEQYTVGKFSDVKSTSWFKKTTEHPVINISNNNVNTTQANNATNQSTKSRSTALILSLVGGIRTMWHT